MKDKFRRFRPALLPAAAGICLLIAGCTSYYEVKDIGTGNTYYTKSINYESGGAVKFTDQRTDAKVVLQESEVEKISRERYEEMTKDVIIIIP